jgi:hypothetical protein
MPESLRRLRRLENEGTGGGDAGWGGGEGGGVGEGHVDELLARAVGYIG